MRGRYVRSTLLVLLADEPLRAAPRNGQHRRVSTRRAALFAFAALCLAAGLWFGHLRNQGRALPGLAAVTGEPRTAEAARAGAQRFFDRASTGDAAGAWDLLSSTAKAAAPKADFVRFATECPSGQGLAVQASDARLDGDSKAVVVVKVMAFAVSVSMVYESGRWLYEPSVGEISEWRQGVAVRIARAKANGSCS